MPQMFQYCGQRVQVYKSAHKTCDTVYPVRALRIQDTVHLDLRCNGKSHGGCQAACLIFWKTAWLKPVNGANGTDTQVIDSAPSENPHAHRTSACTEADIWHAVAPGESQAPDGPYYRCQATQLPFCGTELPWWDARQYVEDVRSGNVSFWELMKSLMYACYVFFVRLGIGIGRPLRWLYDRVQALWGGVPYPGRSGMIPVNQPTPDSTLNLQPGELVQIKSYDEILKTLSVENKNRGLYFDAEMVPYCGSTYRVKDRLHKFIDEKTGKLVTLNRPSILLEDVWCRSRYSGCRTFCPRSIYTWWREAWLERAPKSSHQT